MHLSPSFWTARPELTHIRTAAHARMVSPDALLGSVLTLVCAYSDYRAVLPPLIGSYGSLNVFVGIVGPSGAGKGGVAKAGRELVSAEPVGRINLRTKVDVPIGSGEGMSRAWFSMEPDGKRKVLTRTIDGVQFTCDEGSATKALSERSGQTTFETLRRMFSGEKLGAAYANEEKSVTVVAYRASALFSFQPEHAHTVLTDHLGGTPQRFIWLNALAPDMPSVDQLPDWPGPLPWEPLELPSVPVVDVHAQIVHTIRSQHRDVQTGTVQAGRYDGHINLVRLKLAALLGILNGRWSVDVSDWTLAGQIVRVSAAVRDSALDAIDVEEREKADARHRQAGARKAAEKAAVDRVVRIARAIERKVRESPGIAAEGSSGLRQSLASRDRSAFGQAASHAVAHGWIIERRGRFYPQTHPSLRRG